MEKSKSKLAFSLHFISEKKIEIRLKAIKHFNMQINRDFLDCLVLGLLKRYLNIHMYIKSISITIQRLVLQYRICG